MKRLSFVTILLSTLILNSCTNKSEKLSGAGATFPAPYYNIVFREYAEQSGIDVVYGAIGSGGGIRSLQDKNTDFGATDVFLSDEELKTLENEIIHIPTAMGAVVLSFNLDNDITDLNLTSEIISKIYRGEIKKWNDESLKTINPEKNLPDLIITPVFRSDGSGTTYIFSDYMCKTDQEWSEIIGRGKALNFPTGIAAKGNPGVAGIISETTGSIGYIGSEYASILHIPMATLQNSSGNFIKADPKSISASSNIDMPDDTRVMITNSSHPDAYPISTFTWIIAYKEQSYLNRSSEKAKSLSNLLNYIISQEGQSIALKTHYAPLSNQAVEKAKQNINSMTFAGQPIN